MTQPSTPTVFTGLATALVAADHRIVAASDALGEMLGYTAQELCGRTFESITYPADVDIDSDLASKVFRGELRDYEIAKRFLHKNGSVVRLLIHASLLKDAKGVVYGIAQIRPITGPSRSLPAFQHDDQANDEIERIKRAMLRDSGGK
jgi:PAS domain S-box-containing protein